jgi:hypothetical protein
MGRRRRKARRDRRAPVRQRIAALFRRQLASHAKLAWTTIFGLLITAGAYGAFNAVTGDGKPVSEQIEGIRQEAAAAGMHAIVNRAVDLHGTGAKSYLLALRDDRLEEPGKRGVSDDLRIYDVKDGTLRLEFQFRPTNPRRGEPGLAYQFRLEAVKDLDGNDRPEILGSYTTLFMGAAVPRPVVVVWDEGAQRYRIAPLLASAPRFNYRGDPGVYGDVARSLYQEAANLTDRLNDISISAYGTEEFGVRAGAFPLLIAAFVVAAPSHADPPVYEIKGWRLDFQRPQPQVSECQPLDAGAVLTKPPRTGFADARFFARVWVRRTRLRVSC